MRPFPDRRPARRLAESAHATYHRETKVALDFNLYHSVSPEEMEAFERVVAAARKLHGGRRSDGSNQPRGYPENGIDRRSLAEVGRSLAALDAARARRNRRQAGTVAPWLAEYLHPSNGRGSGWRPGELEPAASLAEATDGD